MNGRRKQNQKLYLLLAFFLPGVIWCLVWFLIGGYPFGDKSILIWDMQQQYADFFQYYKNILQGDMSISYSFAKSLGGNNIALFSYYLSSPLNLLLLFFDDIPLFIFVITGIKFCLCGLTALLFFKNHFNCKKDVYILMFSQCYALMAFNILQTSNIMWLDGVIFLPLLLLAVDYFLKNEKKYILSIFVAISILSNWYSAYMAILFASFYFIIAILNKSCAYGLKEVLKRIVQYGMYCILGIGLSAVLFLPTISSLLLGKGEMNASDFLFQFRESFYQIAGGFIIGKSGNSNQLNLFCGSIILILVVTYFFNTNIELKKRIINGILLGILIFSANFIPLENIWNGFRKVASYYCRFSFVIIMFLLLIAGRNIETESNSIKKFIIAYLITSLFILINYKNYDGDRIWIVITLLFIFVEGGLYLCSCRITKSVKIGFLNWGLMFVVLLELATNMYVCYEKTYMNEIKGYYSYAEKTSNILQEIEEKEESAFYRVESEEHRSKYSFSENLAYNINGIAHYSSALDQNSSDLLHELGYSQTNRMAIYKQPILTTDSLFGVKYLISDTQVQGMKKVSGKIYFNPYALSLGVFTKGTNVDLKENSNPFLMQNKLFSEIMGEETELFVPVDFKTVNDYKWEITKQKDALVYGYIQMSGERDLNLYVNNVDKGNYTVWSAMKVFNVDIPNSSSQAIVELKGHYTEETRTKAVFYKLDLIEFEKVIQKLKVQEFNPEIVSDGQVKGEYNSNEDGYLLLSILYDDGWKVEVNGKEKKVEEFADGLIKIPVYTGKNKIEMFYTAKGVKEGRIISIFSLLILCICIYIEKRSVFANETTV